MYQFVQWISVLVLLFTGLNVYPKEYYLYHTYNSKTAELLYRSTLTLEKIAETIHVIWEIKDQKFKNINFYTLNSEDYSTLVWKVIHEESQTNYEGKRIDDQLVIDGKYQGEEIHKIIPIDSNPFFYNPTLGLSQFVQSKQSSLVFWTLRPSNLKAYKMNAENEGIQSIMVQSQDIDAFEVKWEAGGIQSLLFNRNFWFRKSDAVYLKSDVYNDAYTELVKVEINEN